jgi:hypothetical protein
LGSLHLLKLFFQLQDLLFNLVLPFLCIQTICSGTNSFNNLLNLPMHNVGKGTKKLQVFFHIPKGSIKWCRNSLCMLGLPSMDLGVEDIWGLTKKKILLLVMTLASLSQSLWEMVFMKWEETHSKEKGVGWRKEAKRNTFYI